jgi:hypothetical protein
MSQPEGSRRSTRRNPGTLVSGLAEEPKQQTITRTTNRMNEDLKEEKRKAIKNFIKTYIFKTKINVSNVNNLVELIKEIFTNYEEKKYLIPNLNKTISDKFKNQLALILENTTTSFINSNLRYIVAEVYNEIILPKQGEPIDIISKKLPEAESLEVYKNMTLIDFLKYVLPLQGISVSKKNFLKQFNLEDLLSSNKELKETIITILKDTSSIFYNSLFDIIKDGEHIKLLQDLIELLEINFNINSSKDNSGYTLLMASCIELMNKFREGNLVENILLINSYIDFIKFILTQYDLNPTIQYELVNYPTTNHGNITFTCNPLSFLLKFYIYYQSYIRVYTGERRRDEVILIIYHLIRFGYPSYYLKNITCPGVCYGIVKQSDDTIIIDNIWICNNYSKSFITRSIEHGFDITKGHQFGTRVYTIKETIEKLIIENNKKAEQAKERRIPLEEQLEYLKVQISEFNKQFNKYKRSFITLEETKRRLENVLKE